MPLIYRRLRQVQSRQQLQWLIHCASWGLLCGAAAAVLYGTGRLVVGYSLPPAWVVGIIIAGPVCGVSFGLFRGRDLHLAAISVDAYYGLKDRIATALAFTQKVDAKAVHQLQLEDAERHLEKVDAKAVAPWKTPRQFPWAIGLTAVALGLLAISLPSTPVSAALVTNDVVQAQAAMAAQQIEFLAEQNADEPDEELRELIEQLKAQVQEMSEPGVDAKEAMAKLSEMQAAMMQQQQKLEQASTEAALQAIGDALSIAGSMSAAGSALSAGNYAKASEELDKIEQPPVLDRQTNKTVMEKLDLAKEQIDAVAMKKISEATENLGLGIGGGDNSKFMDGAKGLSGEAKGQGRRKKLKDLLQNQIKKLDEGKSEVEGEFRGATSGKGGLEWGRGKSENQPGEKTSLLDSKKEFQIQGQEGDQGDVDSETSHSPERRESAQRGYREKFEKSQKLNDSVLDSEPIPLGHRQTIRRYFESIRPQQTEIEKVNEKVQAKPAE